MKNFIVAILTGIFVGLVVFVVCWIIGGLPQVTALRTYAGAFGIVAGLLVFARQWDWRLPV